MFNSEKEREEVFNAIFRKYYNNVIYYALHYVETYEEAQDVAHDVFASLWQRLDMYEENAFPVLITMAKNKCLNVLRKEKHKREYSQSVERSRRLDIRLESLENSSLENLLHNDTMKVVMQTLEKMPPKTKEAFMLSRFSHKTYSEIASLQDISEKTVEYRISCALRLLRQAMGLLTVWFIVNLFNLFK